MERDGPEDGGKYESNSRYQAAQCRVESRGAVVNTYKCKYQTVASEHSKEEEFTQK